ncbi:MAG: type II toxin-antitoxin system RelE/ParE family toxin [Planctomyces sp.]|nr:type II toxin-antitoxin system RelE/ParE family toxin [Planctomyces sp.]
MAEQLRFHPLVAEDLKAAVGWYDDISPGLGDRFRIAVEQRFDSIAKFPESFGIVESSEMERPSEVKNDHQDSVPGKSVVTVHRIDLF